MTLLGQLVAFLRFPPRVLTIALRLLILTAWSGAAFFAGAGLFAFNYSEKGAHSDLSLNLPTLGLLLAMSVLNTLVWWLTFTIIPRWADARD